MIEISGNQRARSLVNIMDGVEHPKFQQLLFQVIKDIWGCALSWWNTTSFRFAISERFYSIAVFNSSNWEQYFSEFIVSLVKAYNTLSNPTRYRAWPSLDEDRLLGWLKVVPLSPRSFSLNIIVNDPFFIPRHYLLQKWCLLVAFIEWVANGNAIHQIFLR